MNQQIKLIWDFRGPDAEQIAKHHRIHLDEFAKKENLTINTTGVEMKQEGHFIAYLIVVEQEVIAVRDVLIPHRGELVN